MVDVHDLAGAGVAFVVEHHIVGAHHFFFGTELVAHACFELLAGGMVTQLETAQAFLLFQIDADYAVDQAVETVFVGDGSFKDDVGGLAVGLDEELEIMPHARMDECVEAKERVVVGKDDLGYGAFVSTAVGQHHTFAEEGAYLLQECGVVVVASCHLVGDETGDAQLLEVVEDSGFATAYAAGEGDEEGSIG